MSDNQLKEMKTEIKEETFVQPDQNLASMIDAKAQDA
jgi:hypothetical protein